MLFTFVGLMLTLSTVPDVRLFVAITDSVETKEKATVVRKQSAGAFGHIAATGGIVDVMKDFIRLANAFFRRTIDRLTHATQNLSSVATDTHRRSVFLRVEREAIFDFFRGYRFSNDG